MTGAERVTNAIENLYQDALRLRERWENLSVDDRAQELQSLRIDLKAAERRVGRALGDLST